MKESKERKTTVKITDEWMKAQGPIEMEDTMNCLSNYLLRKAQKDQKKKEELRQLRESKKFLSQF